MQFKSVGCYVNAIICISIAGAMVVLCVLQLLQSRHDTLDRARETSRNLGVVAGRDVVRILGLYDFSLQTVIHGLQRPDVMAAPPTLRLGALFRYLSRAQISRSTFVLDATGKIIRDYVNNSIRYGNFADCTYFTIHRDNPNVGLYISDPLASQFGAGGSSIVLSRRIANPDGSFAGVAITEVNLEYFHWLFAELSVGQNGSISLIGRDGVMIMREPYDASAIGRDFGKFLVFRSLQAPAEGWLFDTSAVDGNRRLYYVSNVPNLPLTIVVEKRERDIFAAWRDRAVIIGVLIATFGCAFVMVTVMLCGELQRRTRSESKLALLARTDGLTGLYNRRSFEDALDREWRRARRIRSTFSLLFIDVDRFKAYNDTYGHQAGDDALAAVARCIGGHIRRPADTAARYGGEEFVVLLSDTPLSDAAQIAERIRTAVGKLKLEHAASEYGHVTVSIGLASWTRSHDGEAYSVVKAADEALYYAKATGRNKVASF
ncbi:sensor domain-containing diguanylate cyclase [Burkholderia ubonensis]|uniref:sensor domain-containing diguanylate cyclase n=1 Tax=Burkholderia ubonensis TaxID=101571 RepID=UPI000BA53925|nr:sensor domain-containing diguanylate cyclase [Burkholderia ubonensis]PAJ86089.1 diguanylate cyclase [Burkholderia ubonensis]PAJ93054.1 diguanylate cyclase [Burkholderia ubonensis]PAK05580.1 diguanylate cyclase [Burkholderia ubonensis]RQP68238.1 sensor domain-containing diguanylate cyclase [Burkholderia ubonensis]RQP84837.1 sensor domain-containing diguanylate cyclase [Burkholderia ubonensis]